MNFAAYRKCPFLGELLCSAMLNELVSSMHSSCAKERVSNNGNFTQKSPYIVPTVISEGKKSYSMEYVWKGVKIPLKSLFTL